MGQKFSLAAARGIAGRVPLLAEQVVWRSAWVAPSQPNQIASPDTTYWKPMACTVLTIPRVTLGREITEEHALPKRPRRNWLQFWRPCCSAWLARHHRGQSLPGAAVSPPAADIAVSASDPASMPRLDGT